MKKIYLSACLAAFLLGGTSCLNDEFLDKYPIDKETENTVFTTYDNFKMYAWGLKYSLFGLPWSFHNASLYNDR